MRNRTGQAQVVDSLIGHLYRQSLEHFQNSQPHASLDSPDVAICAVGGYGRGDLCPHSDVDLLILYEPPAVDFARFLAEKLIYSLWDVGLKVGHSWRTPGRIHGDGAPAIPRPKSLLLDCAV